MAIETEEKEVKDRIKIFGPAVLLVLAGFFIAFQFVKPAPPDRVVIAAGGSGGAYHAFAKAYSVYLANQGIELEVLETQGSVENIQLLHEGKADVALVQGGVEDQNDAGQLNSLGSLYYEPLWLFHREGGALDRLDALSGLKVAVGGKGSGTYALVQQLLVDNGLDQGAAVLEFLGGKDAAAALLEGDVDAAFFVSSPRSELVQSLLKNPQIALSSFERAQAYARRHRFLSMVELPEGLVDLQRNIPSRTVSLLAPAANLVADKNLHPAVIDLLLMAAQEQHEQGDWFERRNEFPQNDLLAYPMHPEAERFFKDGPPFLQRYLPFWAASLIDRIKVMLLPLLLMMLPLIKIMPPVYNWRMRARIYRWYEELERVDQHLFATESLDMGERQILTTELNRIEADVREVRVPLSFSSQLYHLRQHIDLVRQRLAAV